MPMRTIPMTAALAVALLAVAGAAAADPARGELLYENHCSECHTAGVHFREGRKARTREELHAFIVRWQSELELGWTATEIDDVGEHLNRRYYKFAERP